MINEWWGNEPEQRFWMETIKRDDPFGEALEAPYTKKGGTGGYYSLLADARVGDVVLHWLTKRDGRPSRFAGWSQVSGVAYEVDTVFNDGTPTRGRQVPLGGFTSFRHDITQADLQSRIAEIRVVHNQVTRRAAGSAYFPFALDKNGGIRAIEGAYLTKFPIELFDVFPELAEARRSVSPGTSPTPTEPRTDRRQTLEAGYIADAQVRRAIEMQAVAQATAHYKSQGYKVEDVGASRSYDLHLTRLGADDERHVEVKGSTGAADEVELTIGEVKHAQDFQPTDLFVVGGIEWVRTEEGVSTRAGDARLIENWAPSSDSLRAVRFRHTVPEATKVEGIGTDV